MSCVELPPATIEIDPESDRRVGKADILGEQEKGSAPPGALGHPDGQKSFAKVQSHVEAEIALLDRRCDVLIPLGSIRYREKQKASDARILMQSRQETDELQIGGVDLGRIADLTSQRGGGRHRISRRHIVTRRAIVDGPDSKSHRVVPSSGIDP